MASGSIDTRMQELERAVQLLTQKVEHLADPRRRWWIEDAGRFAHDPDFDEIVRLGREYRESLTENDSAET